MARHAIIDRLKSDPCTDCGGIFPPECMDFDHVRGKKLGNISKLPLKLALEELWKCELVCATCHRQRTMERRLDVHVDHALDIDIENMLDEE